MIFLADYVKIIEAVDGRLINFEDQEKWQNMIKIFNEELMSKINPVEILPDLVNKKLISEEELQEISQECRNRGERSANFWLLMCIPRRHPEWYPVFMEVLFLKGWDEFVSEMDADEWKSGFLNDETIMKTQVFFFVIGLVEVF